MKQHRIHRKLFESFKFIAAGIAGLTLAPAARGGINRLFDATTGSWSTPGNWNPSGVPLAGDVATLGNASVDFDFPYNAGGGLLDLTLNTGANLTQSSALARMIVTQEETLTGGYTQNAGINSTGSMSIGSGSYDFSGGSLSTGMLLLHQAAFIQGGGSMSATELLIADAVNSSAAVTMSDGTLSSAFIAVASGGNGSFDQSGGTVAMSGAQGLSVASFAGSGGEVTLSGNALIVDYTIASPLTQVRSLIIAGLGAGSWTGNGITSSEAMAVANNAANPHKTAIGYAEPSDIGSPATFHGLPIDGTAVLVAYTFTGDANLDGKVNILDLNSIATDFGDSGAQWSHGDFNYDGIVNTSDFNLLALNFGESLPTPAPALGAIVPEPIEIAGVAFGGILMRRRGALTRLSQVRVVR